ncbi:MAG: response regulator [Deltaproteobacteria bacterium]|nr:response regulator [Deltaproteobacteria bacterium]
MNKAKKVIFVDDEDIFLKSLQRYFTRLDLGWDIDFYSDPDDALKMLEMEEDAVILLDWTMPKMDGIEFCAKARDNAKVKEQKLHIIMLTGHIGPDFTVNALEHGADDYLTKPATMKDLRTHIEIGFQSLSN